MTLHSVSKYLFKPLIPDLSTRKLGICLVLGYRMNSPFRKLNTPERQLHRSC